MFTDTKLKGTDLSKIHNALWQMQYNSGINDVANPLMSNEAKMLAEKMNVEIEKIRDALKDVMLQDKLEHDKRYAHYRQVAEKFGFSTIWSITEVQDLYSVAPDMTGYEKLVYEDNWDDKIVEVEITGDRWIDLWAAADKAIKQSGDGHHCFIEAFKHKSHNTLRLVTGS